MDFDAATARMDRTVGRLLGPKAVVYTTAAGVAHSLTPAGATLTGIFDANHVQVSQADGQVDTVGPAVSLILADLPVDPKTDNPTLTIGGASYRVRGVGDRDAGRIVLLLSKVA